MASIPLLSLVAASAPICLPNRAVIAAPSDIALHVLKTSVYGKADRRTAKDFAKENHSTAAEVAKRYEASGDMKCGDHGSEIQLVMKNNVILVANHALLGSPCIDQKELLNCKVTFKSSGKPIEVGVKRMMSSGYRCKPGWVNKSDEDWALLELKEPVTAIKPYSIKASPCASKDNPMDVVAVGKSADFGPNPSKGWTGWTKHYANCQLRVGNCGQRFPAMQSDCDTSPGSSGGGMFVGGENPELIGVVSGSKQGCDDQKIVGDTSEFREDCWGSVYVPIAGVLKSQLEELGEVKAPDAVTPKAPETKTPGSRPREPSYQDL